MLYARGESQPHMRFAPLYDIASAWPYPRKLPKPKLKLAMRIGGHYRLREVLPRHFLKLASSCGYPGDRLIESLADYGRRLPDEAADVAREVKLRGMNGSILAKIVDGLAAQCEGTLKQLAVSGAR
jgi:serine/threonine-protein kinase HipA